MSEYESAEFCMADFNYVIFDFDGTVADTGEGILKSLQYSFVAMGDPEPDLSDLKKFIGPPLCDSFMEEYGLTREKAEEAVFLFREYFGVYGWWDNELYPGVPELLARLKNEGYKIVLATSKPDVYSSKILRKFGLSDFFDFSEGASFDHKREKKSDVLEYALSKVGVVTEEDKRGAVLIGDTVYDVVGANEIGIDSIAVTYGFGKREDLEKNGATYVVDKIEDIYSIISKKR